MYCCYKNEKTENLKDVKQKIISDYRIFNPCYQKKEIILFFSKFKEDNLLTTSQYEEIEKKVNLLNDLDLYKLQQSMRVPKRFTFLEKKIFSYSSIHEEYYENVSDEEKIRLYNLLMKFDFFSYLEEQNFIKPKKKKFGMIPDEEKDKRLESLKNLSIQENLSNRDSTYFTIFYENKDDLRMAYVDCEKTVKIFDVPNRQILKEVITKASSKICCIDSFQIEKGEGKEKEKINYLAMIFLDNKMKIYNIPKEEEEPKISTFQGIGGKFEENEDKKNAINAFSLSTVKRGEKKVWIITSYYYDKYYKIYDFDDTEDKCVIYLDKKIERREIGEYIISLESAYLTEQNSYIITRSTTDNGNQTISLFINEFFIKKLFESNDSYINFKVIKDKKYILISKIKKDLSSYDILKINFYQILPVYITIIKGITSFFSNRTVNGFLNRLYLGPGEWRNTNAFTPMNPEIKGLIENIPHVTNSIVSEEELIASNEQKESMRKFYQSNNVDKFNIGNLLLWENDFVLFGTPFNDIDIIDLNKKIKINVNNNNYNNNTQKKENIVAYNFSEMIKDHEYGLTFIMRDNKGKIQYIRPVIFKDRLNYSIKKSNEYFNDQGINEKLSHIYFSYKFYCYYTVISLVTPLIFAFAGRSENADEVDYELIKDAIILLAVYAAIGFWFKGFVHDIDDISHTQRICTKRTIIACLVMKVISVSVLSYSLCQAHKTGIYFVIMFVIIYCVQLVFNLVIVLSGIKFILRTHWLGFAFYQLSRLCILVFFIIAVFVGVSSVQIYIYAAILCVASAYMYLANYFNTLFDDIAYKNYIQAVFNYPLEWMNLICCWFINPKDLIRGLDYAFCCCDSCCVVIGECLLTIIRIFLYIILYIFYFICACIGCFASSPNEDL